MQYDDQRAFTCRRALFSALRAAVLQPARPSARSFLSALFARSFPTEMAAFACGRILSRVPTDVRRARKTAAADAENFVKKPRNGGFV